VRVRADEEEVEAGEGEERRSNFVEVKEFNDSK